MKILIKQWRNETASLILDSGEVLWTFSNVNEAEKACNQWMRTLQSNRKRHHLAPITHYDDPHPRYVA